MANGYDKGALKATKNALNQGIKIEDGIKDSLAVVEDPKILADKKRIVAENVAHNEKLFKQKAEADAAAYLPNLI